MKIWDTQQSLYNVIWIEYFYFVLNLSYKMLVNGSNSYSLQEYTKSGVKFELLEYFVIEHPCTHTYQMYLKSFELIIKQWFFLLEAYTSQNSL